MARLLDSGADLGKFSNKGYFPLHIAALNDRYELIRELRGKATLECRNNEKCTPLHLAAKRGHLRTIQELIDGGANLYAQDFWNWTALHYASFNKHKEAVQMLCYSDSDQEELRDVRNSQGKLAKDMSNSEEIRFAFNNIWKASADGNLDVTRKLIHSGVDPNGTTKHRRRTPLMLAAINKRYLMVKFLLENGASHLLLDADKRTVLDHALQVKAEPRLVRLIPK